MNKFESYLTYLYKLLKLAYLIHRCYTQLIEPFNYETGSERDAEHIAQNNKQVVRAIQVDFSRRTKHDGSIEKAG